MAHITVEKLGRAGVIGLDRPKALNALDQPMIDALAAALDQFEADDSVELVVLRSNHEKAFCAGGDMRRIRELVLEDHLDEAERFFETEYALNLRIATYPKPYVSLIDGVCMGGGLGLSVHGKYRIATERALFAMPETAIGFVPDVGGTYFLPRMPHFSGYWMGLTGGRVKGFDAHALGLSTHLTTAETLETLFDALCFAPLEVEHLIEYYCAALGYQSSVLPLATATSCFGQPTLCSIRECLKKSRQALSANALKAMDQASPRSLQETLTLLQNGAEMSLEDCLAHELEAVKRAIRHPDLAEGVRAVLVDKDHAPNWQSADVQMTEMGAAS